MLKAGIYARYSSALQRPTSVDDQIRRCRQAAPGSDLRWMRLTFTPIVRSLAAWTRAAQATRVCLPLPRPAVLMP
jgi:uncharacterized iron-regulated membrane protein